MAKVYLLTAGLIAWGAWIFQVDYSVSVMMAHGRTFWDAIDRVLTFFTIQTNLALALYYTAHFFPPASRVRALWVQPIVEGALAVYLIFVGTVFALLLQNKLNHTGWALCGDRLLHYVNPPMYLVYWAFYAPKGRLQWRDALTWLLVPMLYYDYVILRGMSSGHYPYPFLDVAHASYGEVPRNAVVLLLLFWLVSLGLIGVDRFLGKYRVKRG